MRLALCMTLLVVLFVSCLVVGCKKEVSEEPPAEDQALGQDLINQVPGADEAAPAPAPAPQ